MCEFSTSFTPSNKKAVNASTTPCNLPANDFSNGIYMEQKGHQKEQQKECREKDMNLICTIINAIFEEVGTTYSFCKYACKKMLFKHE